MKNSEINALSISELIEKIAAEQSNLTKMRFAHAISPIENPNKLKETKRTIARLKTALTASQLAK